MLAGPVLTRPGLALGLSRVAAIAFVCVAVFSAWAWAQQQPPGTEAQAEPRNQPQGKPTEQPSPEAETAPPSERQPEAESSPTPDPPKAEAAPKDEPTTRPAPEAKPKAKVQPSPKAKPRKKRGRTPPFKMDPNAKWACDKMTATHEPVWRGDKKLAFSFEIRNEGTADLKIKAKGG